MQVGKRHMEGYEGIKDNVFHLWIIFKTYISVIPAYIYMYYMNKFRLR